MPQDQRYGRRYSGYDREDERERDYGSGRDDWRNESRSYRSSRYEDDDGKYGQDRRQDRNYQGTLRAGGYGRYEEEEDRYYPERFGSHSSGSDYREREYGTGYRGEYGGAYRSGSYGSGQQDYGGSGSGNYGSGGSYGSRSSSTGYDNYGQSGSSQRENYQSGTGRSAGFGSYTQDYERKYGAGSGSSGNRNERNYGSRERDWWDRATDEVSSWFGDGEAQRRRQMDQHRGRGPKNYSRSDDRIREDVSDRLTDDPLVDASDIDVNVSNQEVTLSGTVHTRQQRRLAEDCAEFVSGVKHVQNNLRVKQPSWSSNQPSNSGGQSSSSSGSSSTTTR